MSTSYSIFVKSSYPFEEILQNLEKILGVNFIIETDQPWQTAYFSGLGLTVRVVGDLDYDDDMGINFSEYDYQIHCDMYARVEEYEVWTELEYYMARYIYLRICEKLQWKCILVEDMQKLLAAN